MAQTCALIAPVQPILHRVSCSNKTLPNAPKHYEMLQNMNLGLMGWTECVLCEKFWCDFMAQTCALIAPVQPILHWVSCSNITLTNAPKHYETHQYMILGSNGGGRCVRCKKFRCDFVPQTFAFIAQVQPVLHRVLCSNKTYPKCTQTVWTHQYISLGSNGADRVRSLQKIPMPLQGTN